MNYLNKSLIKMTQISQQIMKCQLQQIKISQQQNFYQQKVNSLFSNYDQELSSLVIQEISTQMSQQKTHNYLISIAEHLLEQNAGKQVIAKFQRIKSTLIKNQSKQIKFTQGLKSPSVPSKNKKENTHLKTKKRSQSTAKQYLSKTFIRNQHFSPSNKKTIRCNSQRKSSQKENHKINKNNQLSQKKKPSLLIKKNKLFHLDQQTQNLIKTKMRILTQQINTTHNKKYSTTILHKNTEKQINIKTPKKTVKKQDDFFKQSAICLNIKLNNLLKLILQSLMSKKDDQTDKEQQKSQVFLSAENIKLMKNIVKKINQTINNFEGPQAQNNGRKSLGFRKNKQAKFSQIQTNHQTQNKYQGQNLRQAFEIGDQFSFVQLQTPQKVYPQQYQKQQLSQRHSPLIPLDSNRACTRNIDKIQIQKQLGEIKMSFNKREKKLSQKISQLKSDNEWLVENIEKVLNQNQQLKNIIFKQRSNEPL